MALYYKIGDDDNIDNCKSKGLQLHPSETECSSEPNIKYDFSRHILIEFLDNCTPVKDLWKKLGLSQDKNVVNKRIMIDPHRANCRRAIVEFKYITAAKNAVKKLSNVTIAARRICTVMIYDLLSDLCLFERQIKVHGDQRPQQKLIYINDLNKCRGPAGMVRFLREKFSPFGTILSILICEDNGYALGEAVIKFAYLSEAFAAELAYDQFVVGKECLSVTTHHNILLSQCDLRYRLRQAVRHRKSFPTRLSVAHLALEPSPVNEEQPVLDGGSDTPEDQLPENAKPKSAPLDNITEVANSDSNGTSQLRGAMCPETLAQCLEGMSISSALTKSSSDKQVESARSLRKSDFNMCPETLTECLREMSLSSDLTKSSSVGQTGISHSLHKTNYNSTNELPKECQSWTNKVSNWVSSLLTKSNENIAYQENVKNSAVIVDDSFSTLGISLLLRQLSDDLNEASNQSQHSSGGPIHQTKEKITNNGIPNPLLQNDQQNIRNGLRLRKKNVVVSKKLSLRKQRTSFRNVQLPGGMYSTSSGENLFQRPESLANNFYNMTMRQKDNRIFKARPRLSVIKENDNSLIHTLHNKTLNIKQITSPCRSIKQSSLHSKIPLKQKGASPSSVLTENGVNINHCEIGERRRISENVHSNSQPKLVPENLNKGITADSTIQSWLKEKLVKSTNSKTSSSKNCPEGVVCSTMTKDVIISMGCSYMTCNTCYPDSTNLLLGFR